MQPWWLDLVCTDWDAAIAMNGSEVAGIWAYPVEKKLGVSLLRTPLLTPYLGPHIFYPADLKDSRADSYEYETIAELTRQLPPAQVCHLSMPPGLKQAGIFTHLGLRCTVRQTFLIPLADDETTLLTRIRESARKNIRQAEKEITITEDKDGAGQLFAWMSHTLSGKGKKPAFAEPLLRKILNGCITHEAGTLWVARNGTRTEAMVWQVWDNERSYYLAGGQNPEAAGYKAMTLLLWHCIRESKKKGCRTFDLEGSMDEGVERFFRNFGGQRELYMVLQKNESLLWKLKQSLLG